MAEQHAWMYSVLDCQSPFLENAKQWHFASANNHVIACVSIVRYCGWLWVNDLYVKEPWRRHGIARSLVERAIRIEPVGLSGAACGISRRNDPSKRLFHSLGFRLTHSHAVLAVPPNAQLYVKEFCQ